MAVVLPALLPTPTSAPIATFLKTSRTDGKPGRASASRSWTDDKFMNQRKPGRATSSKSWVADKIAPAASDMTAGERAGRVLSGMSGGERVKRVASDMGGVERDGRRPSDAGGGDRVGPTASDMGGGDRAGRGPSDTGGGDHAGRAALDMGGCERAGREESRISWSTVKRPASRAPSTDRCDKKPKAPVEKEAAPEAEQLFAGPTFMSVVPPDPSELPIPYYFLKKKAR